jgi:hypothetical protein
MLHPQHYPQKKAKVNTIQFNKIQTVDMDLVIRYLVEFLAALGIDGGLEFTNIHFMGCPSSCRL